MVLNTGSAGGVAKGLKVGDIVISDETRYHDADVTAFGYEKGQLPANPAAFLSDKQLADLADEIAQSQGQNVKRGLICSGDSFINSEEKIAQIKADFPNVTAVEMEATAIAQVVMPLTYHLWLFELFLMQAMAKRVCHLKNFSHLQQNNPLH